MELAEAMIREVNFTESKGHDIDYSIQTLRLMNVCLRMDQSHMSLEKTQILK